MRKLALTAVAFLLVMVLAGNARAEKTSDLFSNLSEKYQAVRVERVISTDTFVLESGERIKMIGLRSPEVPKNEKVEYDSFGFVVEKAVSPLTTVEEKAVQFVTELLNKKSFRLEFDAQRKSESGATLAYVFTPEGTLINAEILRAGYAYLQIQPPNLKYEELLTEAYREAREEKRGLQGE